MPDRLVASVVGLAGEALVTVFELFWSTMVLNKSPWRLTHKIATMIMGRGTLEEMSLFSFSIVGTVLVLCFVLGALVGVILGVIIVSFHFDSGPGMLAVTGVVFGIVAYVASLYGTTAVFPWFMSERGSGPLLANLLLDVVTAITYGMLERRMSEPMH